jgi:gliding motility-associated-like protein
MQPTNFFRKVFTVFGLLFSFLVIGQELVPFQIRYQRTLKGDMAIVANNIVNRQTGSLSTAVPYNGNDANDNLTMRYIDIDGDPSTFSSSSGTLTVPDLTCSKIVYAGLYWAGTYRYNGSTVSTGRATNFNEVKFKIPGSATYLDITGQVIFDGFTNPAFSGNSPYACYADVTAILSGMANPNGEFTVANVRATQASLPGGISAGWSLFVVYENPLLPGKYITSYDGFAGVNATLGSLDVQYSGFITPPAPLPVRAKLAVSALEGDQQITGDRLQFRANTLPTFSNLFNGLNPANNFFNGTISNLDANNVPYVVTDRTPNSGNTLGYDSDVIGINQTLLPNGSTAATFRMISTQDTYFLFFNALNVDIIEPDINLYKTVENIAGVDISGQDVNLGQVLDYVISFQNTGNDDATSFTINDLLPANTFFQSIDISGAPGVTYVYDPALGQITFTIPDNLVEVGDPIYTIRIRVQVVNTCSELTDACSNIIQNQAYATYQGVLNANVISDDPSYATINQCGVGEPGPSNFLVDIDECAFTRNEILCGSSLVLTAGSGYASYEWYNANGDVIGNTQSITVTSPGNYYVINTPTPPCIGITEYITVSFFGSATTNPVIPFADEVVICPNDGEQLPNIFLCGINDSQLIQTNITDAVSIVWEQLNEASCAPSPIDDCANKNPTCQWNQVGTGQNFTANQAGQYRLVINYQNGCFIRHYFNVYANLLDPQFTFENIVCNTPGSITITNVPTDYEFQLVDQTTNTILVPYQTNPQFPITTPGAYLVQIKQQGVVDGCVFEIPNIGIQSQNLDVNLIPTPITCNAQGSIRVQALHVGPQYYFELAGPVSQTVGPLMDNDFTFTSLPEGAYTVTVTTDDGCSFTDTVTIQNNNTLALTAVISQHISCNEGNIQMSVTGGNPPYVYAIYSYNGVLQNPQPNDFQTSVIFDVPLGSQGDYIFIVSDTNNCTALSNLVTINLVPDVSYTTTVTNVSCNGNADGSIVYTLGNTNGYNLSFQLLDENGVVISQNNSGNFSGLTSGNYTVVMIQTKGNRQCSFPFNFTITEPDALTGTITQTSAYTCLNSSGATIAVDLSTVSGGTPPYAYSIDGVTFGSNSIFTNLTAGNYNVTIQDANGCLFQTNNITVAPLNIPTAIDFTVSTPTCPSLTVEVSLAVTGGTGPFTYEITAPIALAQNNGNNPIFSNLTAGTYTFTVTDSTGCTYSENLTIANVVPIHVSGQLLQNVSCFGATDGAIQYTVSGFTTSYNFTVTNSASTVVLSNTNNTTATIAIPNLPADIYTVTVTDTVTGCVDTAQVTINNPTSSLVLSTAVQPITCVNNGSVVATTTGGWGSNTYQLELPDATVVGPQSSGTFTGLTLAGTYTISVTDGNNCTVSETFTLSLPTDPILSISSSSDLCFDTVNGATIEVTTTGGLAPYNYQINGGALQSSPIFTNLNPGNYTIQVVDANGCTALVTQVIQPQLLVTYSITKNLDCTSTPDASIQILISGGTLPYSYQLALNGGAYGAVNPITGTTLNYTTSTAGSFQFLITDAQGCVFETAALVVQPITNPVITSVTQTQQILCAGDSTGAIQITLDTNFGSAPYVFEVINTTTGVNYGSQTSGLPAGTYTVTITDSNSCTDTATIVLTEPDPLTFTVATVDITCNNPGGTSYGEIIVENVSGGVGPYTYYLSNNFGYSDIYNATANENHSFQILTFGIYTIEVIDANGCSLVNNNITIASPPDDLTIDVTSITTDCATGGSAAITVSTAVSSGNFQFAILEYNTIPYSDNYQPADAGTPETSTFTGLIPGMIYTFVVYDVVTQCYYFKTADLPIDTPSNLTVNLDVISNVTCTGSADGSVSFTFANYDAGATAVAYEIYNAQSNTTTGIVGSSSPLSGGPITVSNFGVLAPGSYFILFTEVGGTFAGCTSASAAFQISQSTNLLAVTASVTKNDNCNTDAGIITAVGQFGTPPYQYQLVPAGDPVPTVATWSGSATNVFNTEGGDYVVYIKDANNCIQSTTITLPTDSEPVITATTTNVCQTVEGQFVIAIDRIGGVGPFSYSINGGAFQSEQASSFTLSNLSSGTYTIEVSDANGCGNTVTVTILAPVSLTSAVVTQPYCSNDNGEVTITATGGSGLFTYSLEDSGGVVLIANQASATFTGLGAGSYTAIVTDTTTGCERAITFVLEVPTLVTFTTTQENVSCFGGNNGSITVVLPVSNDNPPYTYQLDDGVNPVLVQNTPIFTGLTAGTYTITVTSGRLCATTAVIEILEPSLLDIQATATAFVCDASNLTTTATITVTVLNDGTGNPSGTGPYLYSIDGVNFFPTNTFDVVDTGAIQNITVTVKDANNCMQTVGVTIDPLPTITTVVLNPITALTCINPETVEVVVTGGSGDFTFEVLPTGSQPAIAPGAGVYSANFTFNAPGNYTIQVTDNVTGCYFTTIPYEITPVDTITALLDNPTAVTCFGATDGSISLTVSGYAGAYNWQVLDMSNQVVATGTANTTTNPTVIAGLSGGSYQVLITAIDTPFCDTLTNFITVPSPANPLILSAAEVANVTCTNSLGEIAATATGGWGTYLYELIHITSGTTIQTFGTNNYFTGLSAGEYSVTVQDAGGCFVSETVILVQPSLINANINASITNLLCHGDTTASIEAIGVTGGQGTYQYILNYYDASGTNIVTSSGSQIEALFTNLGAGIYSITITDGWDCDFTTPIITITEPTPVVATVSVTSTLTCATQAELTITASGGTPPYLYSVDGVNYTTDFVYAVGPGTYQFYVQDANNCEAVVTNEITILPIPTLDLNLDLSSATVYCFGEASATIIADATGGLGNYMYELLDDANNVIVSSQTSGAFYNLPSGNYVVVVTSGDCIATSSVIQISDPTVLTATATKTDILCFGETNGSITISASGGTGVIQYAISPNLNQFSTDNTFTGLLPGIYTLIAQDQNGCFEQMQVEIIEPAPLVANIVSITDELCLGETDGSITIEITGGTGTYEISLDGVTYLPVTGNQYVFDNLSGDNFYLIFVKDANDCNINPPLEYYMPPAVSINPTASVTPTCTNNVVGNTVVINVDASVSGLVTYSLDDVTYVTSNTFTDLAPGTYTAYVLHTNGCKQTTTFIIEDLQPIAATATVVADVLCFGESTGEIQVTATGGTGDLTYGISPNFVMGTSATFTGLAAGTYDILIQDTIGCEVTLVSITITEPTAALDATTTVTAETCLNAADGSVTIAITGGTAPYSTSLDGVTFTQDVFTYTGLAGGQNYTIYVQDANGCAIVPLAIAIPAGVTINPTASVTPTCTNNVVGNTVVINVDASVSGSVTYSLDDATYVTSNTFTDLAPGTYTAYVLHTNGCKQTTTFTIVNLQPLTSSLTAVDVLCYDATNGSIAVTASGGTGNLSYGISPNFVMGTSATFTGLAAGTYTVRVEDAIGCFVEETIVINQPDALQATLVAVYEETCEGDANGAFEITINQGTAPYSTSLNPNGPFVSNQLIFDGLTGGTTYTVYVRDANNCTTELQVTLQESIQIDANVIVKYECESNTVQIQVNPSVANEVLYALNGGTPQTSNTFVGLADGTYTVEVIHPEGCFETVSFTITNPLPLTLVVAQTGMNQITATVAGGTPSYTYYLNDTNNGSSNVFAYYQSGTYIITVVDSYGCEIQASITVDFVDVLIPNVMTPNDDGQNDTWGPQNTSNYPNITTDIFDRYGRKVKILRQGETWDGRYDGNELPTGDYWYIIKLGNPNDDREFVGHFTIYR